MQIDGIDHVYVETRDFEAALASFEALGFRAASTWGEGGHRAGRLVAGAAVVVLATAPEGQTPTGPVVHLAVSDADAAAAALEASQAVRVLTPLEPTHWGTRWIRLADPDGHVWVLEQPA